MECHACGSQELREFPAEIAIHLPLVHQIDKPFVFVFPKLLICTHCGIAVFTVPEAELCMLMGKDAGAEKSL
jgi:hypothetical protein